MVCSVAKTPHSLLRRQHYHQPFCLKLALLRKTFPAGCRHCTASHASDMYMYSSAVWLPCKKHGTVLHHMPHTWSPGWAVHDVQQLQQYCSATAVLLLHCFLHSKHWTLVVNSLTWLLPTAAVGSGHVFLHVMLHASGLCLTLGWLFLSTSTCSAVCCCLLRLFEAQLLAFAPVTGTT